MKTETMKANSLRAAALAAAILALVAPAAFAAYEDVTAAKYPDADSVLVDSLESVEYKPDGTYTSTSTSTTKILTEKGRREEGVITVGYSARYGKAEILDVRVTGADGVERKVDVSATTKETTDNSSVSSNIYDPMQRKITCTVPGLKVGDVIRYTTRRTVSKPRVKDLFADISVLEWKCPILMQEYRVKAPRERPLMRTAVRNPIGNVKYRKEALPDGSVLHVWTAKDSPQAFEEPDMPPLYKQVQRVIVSTAEDWPHISRWYWDLSLPHLAKTTSAITNRVNEIVASLPAGAKDGDKIAAIYKWVAQEVRYMGLTMEDTSPGYAPHDVNITFDNKYGVCRDKAALLVAMLRVAGFEAFPVLIHAGAKMDPEVPQPYFNHAITAVRAPGAPGANADGFILMDSTDESSRDIMPAYLGNRSYLVATPEGEGLHVSPVVSPDANALVVRSEGNLERDGSLVMESRIAFKGLNDNIYRHAMLRRKPEECRRAFERMLTKAVPGAEVLSFNMVPKDLRETERELGVTLRYRVNEAVLRGETRDELAVPFVGRVLGAANWLLEGSTSLEKRRFPLVVSSTAKVDESVRIELGGTLGKPVSLPGGAKVAGPYSFENSYSVKDGALSAKRVLSVNAVEFSPKEYLDVREGIKRAEAAERARPAFAKDHYAGADVHYLRTEEYCNVTGPSSWVVTNVIEKEILTYDGKKKSAELKFTSNPTWKNIEIVSATVSNRNGRVYSAGSRETTELDCGWAAGAPRYRASRTTVVNLPSVEIGSVITYTAVTTVTNAPCPFRDQWCFDVKEPTDLILVDYRDWKGEKWTRRVENPKRLPSEPMQPEAVLWRDMKTVSHGDFAVAAKRLAAAAQVEPLKSGAAYEEAKALEGAEAKITAVRDWMAKNVRVAGPSLYELPLAMQLTDPAKVVAERYGTRLDYVRTLCATLRGLGLDADVVFAADDALENPAVAAAEAGAPNVAKFSSALCRVKVREGGFLCWGGSTKTYYIGTENEYTPIAATPWLGSRILDPAAGGVGGKVEPPSPEEACPSFAKVRYDVSVRENGAIDIDFAKEQYGSGVGAFRKRYAEMLPEDRSRHFQGLVGAIAQAASATRELVTDIKGYPAKMSFSAYVPDFATVSGDAITLSVPGIGAELFQLGATVRESPIGVSEQDGDYVTETRIVFPKGYVVVEHLPAAYETPYCDVKVRSQVEDGRLVVTVTETLRGRARSNLPAAQGVLLREYSRLASSRATRTVVVRRR